MQTRQLEICVETLAACEAASLGGADRIELCAALGEGGVTPSRGFLQAALGAAIVPVHVLIRPRTGDFVYTSQEFRAMCTDVEDALALGAAGIVIGLLTPDGGIDLSQTASIIRLAGDLPVTFHRAFDHALDLPGSLEVLVDLGCSRILTSGGKPTVFEGLDTLAALTRQAASRIRIAAGGGVTLDNAPRLVTVAGLDLHASLRPKPGLAGSNPTGPSDPLWNPPSPGPSVEAVHALSTIVHGATN